jgi:two-component system sensor histidine kinase MprB
MTTSYSPWTMADGGRWHYRRSLASRVTLLTTMAVGLAVAFVALGAYVTVRMQLQSSLDESLFDRARQTADAPTILNTQTGDTFPAWALVATDVRIALVTSDGIIFKPDRLDDSPKIGAPEIAVASGETAKSIRTVSTRGTEYRVVAVPYGDGKSLVLAQSLDDQQQVLGKLGFVMLVFGLAGVIAAAMAGWAVARNGLRPVRRLTIAVEDIARTENLQPMPVEGDDEIARLTTAFNEMLIALAASRDRQRRLVADAGHELRTPLTSLRTNLDLLAQADAAADGGGLPPQARAELLADVRAQIEELTTLIGDLVELARDEPLAHVVEPVELPEVLDQAVQRVRRRAPDLTFEVDAEPWWVVGEAGGIERALTNLLDNAAKWSPPGGVVTVRLAEGVLTVDDQGPGIAEADIPLVFDRFYRSDDSRSMPGSGLGLSIVRQVAERHSGTVEAGAAPGGGARLTLRLPGSSVPAPVGPPQVAGRPT